MNLNMRLPRRGVGAVYTTRVSENCVPEEPNSLRFFLYSRNFTAAGANQLLRRWNYRHLRQTALFPESGKGCVIMQQIRAPYTREEVCAAVERRGDGKIPVFLHKFWGDGLVAKYGQALEDLASKYPDDICDAWFMVPATTFLLCPAAPEYRFGYKDYTNVERHSIGQTAVLLSNWDELDDFLATFPDPYQKGTFDEVARRFATAKRALPLGLLVAYVP